MNSKIGDIVTCRGCDGSGLKRFTLGREINCLACRGVGQVRMMPKEIWCNRCRASGEVMKGTPGFETYGTCPICGGRGRVKVQ